MGRGYIHVGYLINLSGAKINMYIQSRGLIIKLNVNDSSLSWTSHRLYTPIYYSNTKNLVLSHVRGYNLVISIIMMSSCINVNIYKIIDIIHVYLDIHRQTFRKTNGQTNRQMERRTEEGADIRQLQVHLLQGNGFNTRSWSTHLLCFYYFRLILTSFIISS